LAIEPDSGNRSTGWTTCQPAGAAAATLGAGFLGLAALLVVGGLAAAGARAPQRADD
jgi:hypothetical protein